MNSKDTILVIAGDAGGARAIIPVIQQLKAPIKLYAYDQALKLFASELPDIPCQALHSSPSDQAALAIIESQQTLLLLSATSVNTLNWEKYFFRAAKKCGITSLAVLDFWTSYRERFETIPGSLNACPDYITAMDRKAHDDMISAGINAEIIKITGQPALDDLLEQRDFSFVDAQQALKIKLHDISGKLVLFVSQPLRKFYGTEGIIAPANVLDEQKIFRAVASACQSINKNHHQDIRVLLRRHPREEAAAWNDLLNDFEHAIDVTDLDRMTCLKGCDLVTGIQSMLLIEAALLGKLVISVQPGNANNDCLVTNTTGATLPVYDECMIEPKLEEALLNPDFAKAQQQKQKLALPPPAATRKIIELIEALKHHYKTR